jgi:hypothetical protein
MEKSAGVLVGMKIGAAIAAALFAGSAWLSVWDTQRKLFPLLGFLQNLGFAFAVLEFAFLAGYLELRNKGQ